MNIIKLTADVNLLSGMILRKCEEYSSKKHSSFRLVMSSQTQDAVACACDPAIPLYNCTDNISTFAGIKIFIDNTLPCGEVKMSMMIDV